MDRAHCAPPASGETTGRGQAFACYVSGTQARQFPPEVLDAARLALVDYLGVLMGGMRERPARACLGLAREWNTVGRVPLWGGGPTSAALAALVYGTAAQALDFDDAHQGGGGHVGAVCWPVALAVAMAEARDGHDALTAYLTGYEIMARLGGGGSNGVGRAMQRNGFHPTGVNGTVAAAAVAAALMRLNAGQTAHALGLASTAAAGLMVSYGTDAKPFHAGNAAMQGIVAADLAAHGMTASAGAFEIGDGMIPRFTGGSVPDVPPADFSHWESLRNCLKPFPCCMSAQAAVEAALEIAPDLAGRAVTRVVARVNEAVAFTAGIPEPKTVAEARFSTRYCVATALAGGRCDAADFTDARLNDPSLRALLDRVEIVALAVQPPNTAEVTVFLADGQSLAADVEGLLGHPGKPMSPEQVRIKFNSMAEPVLGVAGAASVYEAAMTLDRPGGLARLNRKVGAAMARPS